MFNSFNGTNRLEIVESKIDLISFNSKLVNVDLLTKFKGYSTARSNSILTWMKVEAKEEPTMILSILNKYYPSRRKYI